MSDTATAAPAIPPETLGDRLTRARKHAGIHKQDLADIIGIGRNSVGRYEADESTPSRPVIISWALATGVDPDWLGGHEVPPHRGRRRTARGAADQEVVSMQELSPIEVHHRAA